MPRGGRRSGVQGRQYPNRSDLREGPRQPVVRIPGQGYGEQAAQVRAQQALPVASQPQIQSQAPAGPVRTPTELVPLDGPTRRPDEPLTAGVDIGPGPGAPTPRIPFGDDPTIQELRALFLAFPNDDLRELLEDHDTGRRF